MISARNIDSVEDKVGKFYSGDRGDAYSQWQTTATRGLGRLVAPKFIPYIARDATVLDFGCGSGENIAQVPCASRSGVEPNPASRAYLEERGIKGYSSLSEVSDGTFDVVMSHHALEHCLTPYTELQGMRRVLKSNGRLVLILPIDDWRNQRRFDPKDINHHLFTWTPLLIGNLVQEAGFRLVEVKVLNYQWPPKVRFLSNHVPRPLFNALCWAWSIAFRMREMRVIAVPI